MNPVPEEHAASDAYWVGRLSAAIAIYLRADHDKRKLQAAFRAFLKSPVCDDELKRLLGH
jgi:hypothetical protein